MSKVKKTNEISAKQVGRNIILVIDGKQYSRGFTEKSDRVELLSLIKKYNEKNTSKDLKTIVATITEDSKKREASKTTKTIKSKPKESMMKVSKKVVEKSKDVAESDSKFAPKSVRGYSGEY